MVELLIEPAGEFSVPGDIQPAHRRLPAGAPGKFKTLKLKPGNWQPPRQHAENIVKIHDVARQTNALHLTGNAIFLTTKYTKNTKGEREKFRFDFFRVFRVFRGLLNEEYWTRQTGDLFRQVKLGDVLAAAARKQADFFYPDRGPLPGNRADATAGPRGKRHGAVAVTAAEKNQGVVAMFPPVVSEMPPPSRLIRARPSHRFHVCNTLHLKEPRNTRNTRNTRKKIKTKFFSLPFRVFRVFRGQKMTLPVK